MQRDVVAGVHDGGHIFWWNNLHDAFEKARSAHAARECNDHVHPQQLSIVNKANLWLPAKREVWRVADPPNPFFSAPAGGYAAGWRGNIEMFGEAQPPQIPPLC